MIDLQKLIVSCVMNSLHVNYLSVKGEINMVLYSPTRGEYQAKRPALNGAGLFVAKMILQILSISLAGETLAYFLKLPGHPVVLESPAIRYSF